MSVLEHYAGFIAFICVERHDRKKSGFFKVIRKSTDAVDFNPTNNKSLKEVIGKIEKLIIIGINNSRVTF